MYEVDDQDQVINVDDMPQSSGGAPLPIVLADEHYVLLAYYLRADSREFNVNGDNEPIAIVKFNHCYAHFFGPPNDEALHGHPLSSRGLHPSGVFEIKNSSWLRKLERMNSVHPAHNKERFMANKHHFIFSFHDSIFECIAQSFVVEVKKGSMKKMISYMIELLG